MSRGILFYAHNNRHIDYGKIALANSCLIKKHMKNNSVTIVTDEGTVNWVYKAYDKDFKPWYDQQAKRNDWNFKEEMIKYCRADTELLSKSIFIN